MANVILFDFDNTLANTEKLREIREQAKYDDLNEDILSGIKTYKPIGELLQGLKSRGVKIGLVTNSGRRYIDKLLAHLRIDHYFDAIVTYTEVKSEGKKPSPLGIRMALEKLGCNAGSKILFIGDENSDLIAAYRAGITPALPSWASRKAVSVAPALEFSTKFLLGYIESPEEYMLAAEKAAELKTFSFERKQVYFLPLGGAGDIITVKDELKIICFGRYFSQKSPTTKLLHNRHELSLEIARKEQVPSYTLPPYLIDLLAHAVKKSGEFLFKDSPNIEIDIVTIIPGKLGREKRLENALTEIASKCLELGNVRFIPDLMYFLDDAKSQKTLGRDDRIRESERSLHIREKYKSISNKRILVIDDVLTTGSTMGRAIRLLEANKNIVFGVVLAKTVSIQDDEKECSECGRPMRIRVSPITAVEFWGCSGYSDQENKCTNIENIYKKNCPDCGREMAIRKNKRGTLFWSCMGYNSEPKCNRTMNFDRKETET